MPRDHAWCPVSIEASSARWVVEVVEVGAARVWYLGILLKERRVPLSSCQYRPSSSRVGTLGIESSANNARDVTSDPCACDLSAIVLDEYTRAPMRGQHHAASTSDRDCKSSLLNQGSHRFNDVVGCLHQLALARMPEGIHPSRPLLMDTSYYDHENHRRRLHCSDKRINLTSRSSQCCSP